MTTTLEKIPLELLGEICRASDTIQDDMIDLLDLTMDFVRRNPKVRAIVAAAVFLAAGPSDLLDDVFRAAKRAWHEEVAAVRRLEAYHGRGVLPPDHRTNFPKPSFARAA